MSVFVLQLLPQSCTNSLYYIILLYCIFLSCACVFVLHEVRTGYQKRKFFFDQQNTMTYMRDACWVYWLLAIHYSAFNSYLSLFLVQRKAPQFIWLKKLTLKTKLCYLKSSVQTILYRYSSVHINMVRIKLNSAHFHIVHYCT